MSLLRFSVRQRSVFVSTRPMFDTVISEDDTASVYNLQVNSHLIILIAKFLDIWLQSQRKEICPVLFCLGLCVFDLLSWNVVNWSIEVSLQKGSNFQSSVSPIISLNPFSSWVIIEMPKAFNSLCLLSEYPLRKLQRVIKLLRICTLLRHKNPNGGTSLVIVKILPSQVGTLGEAGRCETLCQNQWPFMEFVTNELKR